jgi:two-component system, sensor histidine kinase and response regulator
MRFFSSIQQQIAEIGYDSSLPEYTKKRVLIFNQLNFLAFLLSLMRFFYISLFTPRFFSVSALLINFALCVFFISMMWIMHKQFFRIATISSFFLVPPLFALVSWATKDNGMDMFVLLYMMFSFFFLNQLKNIIIAFLYCLIFFLLIHFIFQKGFNYRLSNVPNLYLIIFNYLVAFLMFFATLYLIKYQVWVYEKSVKEKTKVLAERNIEIEAKNETLSMQAVYLETTTQELTELNQVKTKLFSVISHDLRTSIYALKNIFEALRLGYISKEDLINELPGLSNEIDNCTEVMENLLNWGRDQFKESRIVIERIDLREIAAITFKHLLNRANRKNITLVNSSATPVYVYADVQMIKIVMRNLVANAVKFTPAGGSIEIFTEEKGDFTNVCVKDNGIGMTEQAIAKVFSNEYYTTLGTNKETGTGLGLIICRDFIKSNNGNFVINSVINEGTIFTISLPKHNNSGRAL